MATTAETLRDMWGIDQGFANREGGSLGIMGAPRQPSLEDLYTAAPETKDVQYGKKSKKYSQANYRNLLAELEQRGVPRANKFAQELAEYGLSTISQLKPVSIGGKNNVFTNAFYDPVTNQYLPTGIGDSSNHNYTLRNVNGQVDFQVKQKTSSGVTDFLTAAALAFGGGAALSALTGGAALGSGSAAAGTGAGTGAAATGGTTVGGTAASTIPVSAFGPTQAGLGSGIGVGGGITGSVGGLPSVAGVQSGALAGTGLVGNAASGLGLAALGQAPGYLSSLGLPETFGAESAFGPGATYGGGAPGTTNISAQDAAKLAKASGALGGGGQGGGLGGLNLSDLIGGLGSIYQAMDTSAIDEYRDIAAQALERGDPFGGQRGYYQDLLRSTYTDPQSVFESQYGALDQTFFNELMAQDAARGRQTDAYKRGVEREAKFQDWMTGYRGQLGGFAGANIDPSRMAGEYMGAMGQAALAQQYNQMAPFRYLGSQGQGTGGALSNISLGDITTGLGNLWDWGSGLFSGGD